VEWSGVPYCPVMPITQDMTGSYSTDAKTYTKTNINLKPYS